MRDAPRDARLVRRQLLKGGVAVAGLTLVDVPAWMLPVLGAEETVVPFTDLPATINLTPTPDRRLLDIRTIEGPLTPADRFFTTQHYGHPVVDPATFRLKVTGLVEHPLSLSLEDMHTMHSVDLVAGFECSGNGKPLQGLSGNGRWTGVPLRAVLDRAGVKKEAREFVFFGADHGDEDVEFRGRTTKVDQQFARALTREHAMAPEPILAYALNGAPLQRSQGFPLRLLVPGWYGVSNVKWLMQIHVQLDPFLGKYQARWYRTLRGEDIGGEVKWTETAVTHMRLKSFIARITRSADSYKVLGVVLNDGTPIKSVEVRVDDGPWQPAVMDATTKDKYSWKLFTFVWKDASPGEHTLVSRVMDVTGAVQPTAADLENKKTFLEDNSQYPRKVKI
jgi:DMSO/TMAO reductase YedYZ molybdopterin-dependent catalytic subunit